LHNKSKKDLIELLKQKLEEILIYIQKNKADFEERFCEGLELHESIIETVKIDLLKKANFMIANIEKLTHSSVADDKENEKLIKELKKNGIELDILSTILKSFSPQGQKINIKTIKNLNCKVKEFGECLSPKDVKEILEITEENWKGQNKKLAPLVIAELKEELKNSENLKIYILEYFGDILSFIKFKPLAENTLYVGSLNVEPELRGMGFGQGMMINALATESANNTLVATVSPRLQAGCTYVESFGFIIDGLISNYHRTGELLFTITLEKLGNFRYQLRNFDKKLKKDEIIKRYHNNTYTVGQEIIILKYNMVKDYNSFKSVVQRLLINKNDLSTIPSSINCESKYIISRYFQTENNKGNDIRYFVLEKIQLLEFGIPSRISAQYSPFM